MHLVGLIGLVDVGHNHLADFIVVHHDLIDFIGHNGLVRYIGLSVSFIGGFIGFVGLGIGIVSLGGIIGNIRLVGFIGFVGLVLVGFIGLGLVNQLIGLIGLISLGLVDIISLIGASIGLCITSLVGSSASSAHQLIGLISFVIAAKTISRWLKQAAALGVATLQSSATKIIDVAIYYFASSSLHVYSLVKEKMLWWLALAKKKMWRCVLTCLPARGGRFQY